MATNKRISELPALTTPTLADVLAIVNAGATKKITLDDLAAALSLGDLGARSASDLSSGTLPDGRFPATLPAASGANLTTLNAGNVSSGVLATARGGNSVDIASAALPLGSGQITFPATQNPSGAANTFDDFERGTWTPSFGGFTSESGQTYIRQNGEYLKIADLVIAWFTMQLSVLGTITGAVMVKGLPFTVKNTVAGAYATSAAFWSSWTSSFVVVQCNPQVNTTQAFVLAIGAASTTLAVQPVQADMGASSDLRSTLIYRATA